MADFILSTPMPFGFAVLPSRFGTINSERERFFHFFFLRTSLLYRKGIRRILGTRSISRRPELPPRYPLLQPFLMIIDDVLDFAREILLLADMLVIDIIEILSTALVGLVGQPHLDLSLLLLQSESVDHGFDLCFSHYVYFFLASSLLLDFESLLGLDFG